MSSDPSQSALQSALMTLLPAAAPNTALSLKYTTTRAVRYLFLAALMAAVSVSASAQISFTTAVDLALRNSPKVGVAQADVNRALASLRESKDVYVPNLIGGAGLAYSYGAPLGQPTLFTINSTSLVYNAAQRDYIRAARAGLQAANLTLREVRQQVAEDTAVTYLSLDRGQQRKAAMSQEFGPGALPRSFGFSRSSSTTRWRRTPTIWLD
jgi:outer membrane protein TolC